VGPCCKAAARVLSYTDWPSDLKHTQIYILDAHKRAGADRDGSGEIYVGGGGCGARLPEPPPS